MAKDITTKDLIYMLEEKVETLDRHFPQIKGSADGFISLLKESSKATGYTGSFTKEQAEHYMDHLEKHYISRKLRMKRN